MFAHRKRKPWGATDDDDDAMMKTIQSDCQFVPKKAEAGGRKIHSEKT